MKINLKGLILVGISLLVLMFLVQHVVTVKASESGPQIDLGHKVVDDVSGGTDRTATYIVYTYNFGDETGSYEITLLGLPSGWTYSLTPSKFDLAPNTKTESTLVITAPVCTPPDWYTFTVFGKETKSDPDKTDSVWVEVYVSAHVIPEFPIGTIIPTLSALGVLAIYTLKPRARGLTV